MIETELKIALAPHEAARLERHPAIAALRAHPRRTRSLLSVYYDTQDHALGRAGIALRLRKVGRGWVQTVKRGRSGGEGLFSHLEVERPAPGGRLDFTGDDPEGVYRSIREVSGDAPLSAVFETRIRRRLDVLRLDEGLVELALDRGAVVAGEASEAIDEVEIELVEGGVGAVYEVARLLFPSGPVRLATENKSARGYRIARGEPAPALRPRTAGVLAYGPEATVETVARDVFRDCHGQIAANLLVVAETAAVEGPHQLRVGLRRLRSAFAVFAPGLGAAALAPLSEEARRLGQVVGRLRDIDVLIEEVVPQAGRGALDEAARAALAAVLEARREAVRADVRAELEGAAGFLFDLGRLIETRGWLDGADYSQTSRLAAPIAEVAPGLLERRYAKALKRGRHIRRLDTEALHALRKEIKKLRYTADVLDPIYPGKPVTRFIKGLKQLQDAFGSLNDAAMAGDYLTGPEAPGLEDPAVQRATGWVLGTVSVRAEDDRPALFARWEALTAVKPFWR